MYEFVLPDIGEGISEALLISWSVKAGEQIKEGDEVATISTDKVDVELPSPRSGTISELCWQAGDTVKVGSVFLRIDTGEGAATERKTAEPAKSPAVDPETTPAPPIRRVAGQIVAAPSTRKRAGELDVDLSAIAGSGPAGRILRSDVEAAAGATPPEAGKAGDRREVSTPVRRAMAERMSNSVHLLAHSTMNFEVNADAFLTLLEKFAPKAEDRGVRLSPTALFASCAGAVLSEHPRFNATIDEDAGDLMLHRDVNLGIALATERGLLVPVVKCIDRMSLFEVARELTEMTTRGRRGDLNPKDVRGGTFTLSNTGNLERATITSTRPIINAPQTAILWVSRITDRPRAAGHALEVGPVVCCSLSFDHRFIDGADAVAFVNDMAAQIESPEQALTVE